MHGYQFLERMNNGRKRFSKMPPYLRELEAYAVDLLYHVLKGNYIEENHHRMMKLTLRKAYND
ncbi:MAG: hypothetical protein SCARUB_00080 [Candidatus Scalindua rubra]|uniref:Uncharacterized protein n=1 Tax=Candidatus Scalindua rubra TaxID=1872076 RepID=A0A1E3XGS7_9BACT|nr:MAG: hypothetical protein SCARUB_00080 [Candidatus Scalindua rubra]